MITFPSISIIIPLYNVADYIEQCLQSVVNQTYQGLVECIIVNDCGTDDSLSITEQFIADYKGPITFRLLHHDHNRGLSAARNTGVAEATGEYILFVDSDDYISNDCLKVLTEPLQKYSYDMVLGDLEMFGNPRPITFLPEGEGEIIANENIFHRFYAERTIYVMAWNKLIRAALFKKHDFSFLDGQLHEDELWSYKVMTKIESIYIKKNITYYYRIRENSITADYHSNVSKRLDSCYQTLRYVLEHPANVPKEEYNRCCVYYFGVYLRNVLCENFHYRNEYIGLRKMFDYHPLLLWYQGKLKLIDIKHQFHFALPPLLGYWYLKIKRIKHIFANQ